MKHEISTILFAERITKFPLFQFQTEEDEEEAKETDESQQSEADDAFSKHMASLDLGTQRIENAQQVCELCKIFVAAIVSYLIYFYPFLSYRNQ